MGISHTAASDLLCPGTGRIRFVCEHVFRPEPSANNGHGIALTALGGETGGRMAEKAFAEKAADEQKRHLIRKRGKIR